ncbi:MAG: hypothetical protein LIP01_16105 [Tannerellaceae bacterium]|nr:hypothetical protein [Tannerellaceae bacterium]
MTERLSRQEIYDRIRTTGKESYILEEMKRLGFWDNSGKPTPSEILIQKEKRIRQELGELLAKENKYNNPEKLLVEMHKERMKKAKAEREATKQKK